LLIQITALCLPSLFPSLPTSQTSLQAQVARVCELESENRRLVFEVESVKTEAEGVRKEAEEGKRAALEQ